MLYKALFTLADSVSEEKGLKIRMWGADLGLSTERRVLHSLEWLEMGSRSTRRPGRKRGLGTF